MMVCTACGSKWQGYKTRKGRRKPGQTPIETFYYCCGGYVRRGNAGCKRSVFPKVEMETAVMRLAEQHLSQFLETGGSDLLANMVGQAASYSVSEEAALKARIAADRKRLDDLIACLTPDLAAALRPKITELTSQIEHAEARVADLHRFLVTQEESRQIVEALVQNAREVREVIREGTTTEQRAILCGLVQEIRFDPQTGRGEVVLRQIPLAFAPQNEAGTQTSMSMSPSRAIAGAHFFAIKSEFCHETLSFLVKIRHRERLVA
jgi:hypothetical protein